MQLVIGSLAAHQSPSAQHLIISNCAAVSGELQELVTAWEEPADKSITQTLLFSSVLYRYRKPMQRTNGSLGLTAQKKIIRISVFDSF